MLPPVVLCKSPNLKSFLKLKSSASGEWSPHPGVGESMCSAPIPGRGAGSRAVQGGGAGRWCRAVVQRCSTAAGAAPARAAWRHLSSGGLGQLGMSGTGSCSRQLIPAARAAFLLGLWKRRSFNRGLLCGAQRRMWPPTHRGHPRPTNSPPTCTLLT